MAKKWTKGIVGLAAIGAAAAGILYMKNKKDEQTLEEYLDKEVFAGQEGV